MTETDLDHAADALAYSLNFKKKKKRSFMDRIVSPILALLIILLITLTLYHAGSYMAAGIESATKAIF